MVIMNEFLLNSRYHEKMVDWQKRNFPQIDLLTKYWDKYFPDERPFSLNVKIDDLANEKIEYGVFEGQRKIDRAGDMKGNMLYSALRIIKAQCSTEFGSIQQHVCTLDATDSDATRFKIIRVMAEEFRHAYQMFWVLSHDDSWASGGIKNLGDNTMDELLAMHTGTHVLDAFNIPFEDALDNVVFAFLIDRVGKYQLTMQKVFAYAPMARSMGPMLKEESFHLKFGFEVLRDIVENAAVARAPWTLGEIQQRINAWMPRGLEMFGNPKAGETNVAFSFKNRLNGPAVDAYYKEVQRLVDRLNLAIIQARHPDLDKEAAKRAATEGMYGDLLCLPHPTFFRHRGPEELTHQSVRVDGSAIKPEVYADYLNGVLPKKLRSTEFYDGYLNTFKEHRISD